LTQFYNFVEVKIHASLHIASESVPFEGASVPFKETPTLFKIDESKSHSLYAFAAFLRVE